MSHYPPPLGSTLRRVSLLFSWCLAILLTLHPSHSYAQVGRPLSWGANWAGQLGIGYYGSPFRPQKNPFLKSIVQIAGSARHVLAIKQNGTVMEWGGDYGQGNTGYSNTPSPTLVPGLTHIVQVSCSSSWIRNDGFDTATSLALKSDGTVWAWGLNSDGQLGDGTVVDKASPMQISGLTQVAQVNAIDHASYALKSDGTLWIWGFGIYPTPVQETSLPPIAQMSGSLFLATDGTVWENSGLDSNNRPVYIQMKGLSNVVKIACGGIRMALKSDGTLWTWGFNGNGQLGNGTFYNSYTPVQVVGLSGITSISSGYSHTLATKSDGTTWAWGSGNALGNGYTFFDQNSPQQVLALTGIKTVVAASHSSFALTLDGDVFAWGDNSTGLLGLGNYPDESSPTSMATLGNIVQISNGFGHTVALKSDGTVWATGWNAYGQLGDGTFLERATPVQVLGLTGVIHVAATYEHSLAVKSDGTVWAWGFNDYNQLGDGTTTTRNTPVQVKNFTDAVQVAGIGGSSHILKADGTVWSWGGNGRGELGDGTTVWHSTPKQIPNFQNVIQISAGWGHILALKSDGSVWAWGYCDWGSGGVNKDIITVPTQITQLSGIVQVCAGFSTSYALASDGTVWVWGRSSEGQLGDGTHSDAVNTTPVAVPNLNSVVQITAGYFPIALKSDGTVWLWGTSGSNVGDGTREKIVLSPTMVPNLINQTLVNSGISHFSVQAVMLGTNLNIGNVSLPRSSSFTLSTSLLDRRGARLAQKPVAFLINGKEIGSANTNLRGQAVLNVSNGNAYPPGTYTLRVRFAGDRLFKPTSTKAILTIVKADTSLTTENVTLSPGEKKFLTATLTQKLNGASLLNKTIKFRVDNKLVGTALTDGTGKASLAYSVDENQSVGKHALTAQFGGDSDTSASSATATLTITQATSQTTAQEASGKQGEKVSLMALLIRTTDQKGLKTKELHFLVDGKEVGVIKTDKSGKGVMDYIIPSSLTKGKHTLKVLFNGDGFYQSSSDSSKYLTVK